MTDPGSSVTLPELDTLANGKEILIRHVMPDDRGLFLAAWERLSPESRYRRFLGKKEKLSEEELDFYTQVDGHNHIAIGALALNTAHQPERGIAVARVVRADDEQDVGELGIVVVDDWQGQGVGEAVMLRLLQLANEQGIYRIRAHAWSTNEPISRLLHHYPYQILTRHEGGEMHVELNLREPRA